jgi:hypothetical protein
MLAVNCKWIVCEKASLSGDLSLADAAFCAVDWKMSLLGRYHTCPNERPRKFGDELEDMPGTASSGPQSLQRSPSRPLARNC